MVRRVTELWHLYPAVSGPELPELLKIWWLHHIGQRDKQCARYMPWSQKALKTPS
jgi:hypothetical protein